LAGLARLILKAEKTVSISFNQDKEIYSIGILFAKQSQPVQIGGEGHPAPVPAVLPTEIEAVARRLAYLIREVVQRSGKQ
jgi:hypothetical protein